LDFICRGVEVETRPSRLGLARVSIVRGSGPLAGHACIDDYIRAVEPVYDYLTKYSGLVSGVLTAFLWGFERVTPSFSSEGGLP
jgi:hypothetical protein